MSVPPSPLPLQRSEELDEELRATLVGKQRVEENLRDTQSDLDRVAEECAFIRAKADEYSHELKESIVQEQKWELAEEFHTRKLYRKAFSWFRRGVVHSKVFFSSFSLHTLARAVFLCCVGGGVVNVVERPVSSQLLHRAQEATERQRVRSLMEIVFFEWRRLSDIERMKERSRTNRLLETFSRWRLFFLIACPSFSHLFSLS